MRHPLILWLFISLSFILPAPIIFAAEPAAAHQPALTMGIFPRRNAQVTMHLFRPLAHYLSEQLGREVRLVTAKNFTSFWQDVEAQKYDLVHYNQYHYIVSRQKYGYQVILKNEEFGEATIAGALLVRKDSGIQSMADLKGKKIVFGGGPKAMQSYIVATYLLRQAGLQVGDYEEEFAKNPPNAILSAFYGQAAAAGAGDKVLRLKVVQQHIDTEQMTFLARSEQLVHLPWAVKADLDTTVVEQIQSLLSQLKQTEAGRALLKQARLSGLVRATDAEYNTHRDIIKAVYGEQF